MLAIATKFSIAVMLLVGLLSGIIMQIELLEPGLDIFRPDNLTLYLPVRAIHIAALGIGLPICLSGGLACLIWHKHAADPALPNAFGLSVLATGWIGCLCTFLIANGAFDIDTFKMIRLSFIPTLATATFAIAMFAAIKVQTNRAIALFCLLSAALCLLVFTYMRVVALSVPNEVLYDTWFIIGFNHAAALAFIFSSFALTYSFQGARERNYRNSRFARVLAFGSIGVALGLGLLWTAFQGVIGYAGMPAAYADYNPAFAKALARSGLVAFGLTIVLTLTAARLSRLKQTPANDPSQSF